MLHLEVCVGVILRSGAVRWLSSYPMVGNNILIEVGMVMLIDEEVCFIPGFNNMTYI